MVGIVIILLGIAFAPGIKSQIDDVRNSDNLDCSNAAISDFDKITCVTVDYTIFYFVMGIIFLGGAVVVARRFL